MGVYSKTKLSTESSSFSPINPTLSLGTLKKKNSRRNCGKREQRKKAWVGRFMHRILAFLKLQGARRGSRKQKCGRKRKRSRSCRRRSLKRRCKRPPRRCKRRKRSRCKRRRRSRCRRRRRSGCKRRRKSRCKKRRKSKRRCKKRKPRCRSNGSDNQNDGESSNPVKNVVRWALGKKKEDESRSVSPAPKPSTSQS